MMLPLAAWFSLFEFSFGNPLIVAAAVILLFVIGAKLYLDSSKKKEDEPPPAAATAPVTPPNPSDLNESLRSLANIVNFLAVPDGAIILNDLAAGDYEHAPRSVRALATKLDTPEGRKELVRRVIEKHAHLFAGDSAIVSLFASVMAKAKR